MITLGAGGSRDSRIKYLAAISSRRWRSRMMCSACVGNLLSFSLDCSGTVRSGHVFFAFDVAFAVAFGVDFVARALFGFAAAGVKGASPCDPCEPVKEDAPLSGALDD